MLKPRIWQATEIASTGFALAAAVLALVVVGALVTGTFYAASREGFAGVPASTSDAALYAAEQGINHVLGTKPISFYEEGIDIGAAATVAGELELGGVGAEYTVVVHRLARRLFFLEATGRVAASGRQAAAARRVGLMARTPYFEYPRDRALQTRSAITLRGASYVNGADVVPPGWEDCDPGAPATGIVALDTGSIVVEGAAGVRGRPPIVRDATLAAADVLEYGDMTFDEFAAIADRIYAPGSSPVRPAPTADDGACDTLAADNWGDPLAGGACADFFPIVYAAGDLDLRGGSGQGILAVEGDLRVSGDLRFAGIVIVKGNLLMSGSGATIMGTVDILGSGAGSEIGGAAGGGKIRFSSCAIDRAYRRNEKLSRAFAIGRRSWIDLNAVDRAQRNS